MSSISSRISSGCIPETHNIVYYFINIGNIEKRLENKGHKFKFSISVSIHFRWEVNEIYIYFKKNNSENNSENNSQ